jgi:phage FluMu gp28-like protein
MEAGRRVEMAERMLDNPLYFYQKSILLAGMDPQVTWRLINASRQVGKSTTIAVEAAIDALYHKDYQILLVSLREEQAAQLLDHCRKSIRALGEPFYKEQVVKDSHTELKLQNGSRLISLTSNPKNARGYTGNHIYLDEFAHLDRQGEWLDAITGTMVRKGKVTISSTPNGVGDAYHSLWTSSSDMWKQEIPWTSCPDLSEVKVMDLYQKLQLSGEAVGSFEQEFCCSFDSKVESIWSWAELQSLLLYEWDQKARGTRYLGWDPAQVTDRSAVVVIEKTKKGIEVVHLADLKGQPYPVQAQKVMELVRDLGVSKVYLDDGGIGKACYDLLLPIQHKVKRVNFSSKFKKMSAYQIKTKAEREGFKVRDVVDSQSLLKDLFLLRPDTNEVFTRSSSGHCDYAAALFLAWQGTKRRSEGLSNYPSSVMRATQPCLADRVGSTI